MPLRQKPWGWQREFSAGQLSAQMAVLKTLACVSWGRWGRGLWGPIVSPLLCLSGDLVSVPDFPFLYFYRFHGSCCASGLLGFFLMLSTVKLKSLMAPGQCAAWIFFAKVITAGSSVLLFDMTLTSATVGCLLLGGLGEALLVFSEQKGS